MYFILIINNNLIIIFVGVLADFGVVLIWALISLLSGKHKPKVLHAFGAWDGCGGERRR